MGLSTTELGSSSTGVDAGDEAEPKSPPPAAVTNDRLIDALSVCTETLQGAGDPGLSAFVKNRLRTELKRRVAVPAELRAAVRAKIEVRAAELSAKRDAAAREDAETKKVKIALAPLPMLSAKLPRPRAGLQRGSWRRRRTWIKLSPPRRQRRAILHRPMPQTCVVSLRPRC